ncbi:MAG: methyl-accepting chemotaxis protein [Deltaproteobacteria bacterium]|nr:methyl-accepting chemotaxis protein [Deltaproteobacteria bacterium]
MGIRSIYDSSWWVEQTYQVIAQAENIKSQALDMETSQRGYLLAGKEEYLSPYLEAEKNIHHSIASLKNAVADNPKFVEKLTQIDQAIKDWQTKCAQPAIDLRREIGQGKDMNDIGAIIAEGRGKTYIDKFRGQITVFINRQNELLEERKQKAKLTGNNSEEDKEAADSVERTYNTILQADKTYEAAINMETGVRGYLLSGKEPFLYPYHRGHKEFYKELALLKTMMKDDPGQLSLLHEIDKTISELEEKDILPLIDLRHQIANSKTIVDLNAFREKNEGKVIFDKFRQLVNDFIQTEKNLMDIRKTFAEKTFHRTQYFLVFGIMAAIAVGMVISLSVARIIIKQVGGEPYEMAGIARKVAEGDLTVKLEKDSPIGIYAAMKDMTESLRNKAKQAFDIASGDLSFEVRLTSDNDGLGKALQMMAYNLNDILHKINEAVSGIACGAGQISDSSKNLSDGASEQSASLKQITSSITELTSQTKSNAENSAQANQLALAAK